MDLHELFLAFAGARRVSIDYGISPDRTMFRCSCGYTCELVEILAIHAVREHNFPFGAGDLKPNILLADYVWHQSAIVITRFYESDQPYGPWTEIRPGAQPTKRYMRRVDTN